MEHIKKVINRPASEPSNTIFSDELKTYEGIIVAKDDYGKYILCIEPGTGMGYYWRNPFNGERKSFPIHMKVIDAVQVAIREGLTVYQIKL